MTTMRAEGTVAAKPQSGGGGCMETAAQHSYTLLCTSLERADRATIADWKQFRERHPSNLPADNPQWLRGYFDGQTQNISIYSLYDSGDLSGLAAFLRRAWPMKLHLGELRLASIPLKRLRFLGSALDFPPSEAAYDTLFKQLLAQGADYDAIYLEEVPIDSFLWKYLQTSSFVRQSFLRYEPDPPAAHPLLRFEGSFADYMAKFSSKHRKNLNREVKRVRDGIAGEMKFVRYEQPAEVAEFLDHAVEVSRKTYQWTLHKRGLSATEQIRKRLSFAAENGWMRCYLLFCDGRACAFVLGFQHEGRFLLHEIGFDPALAKHSLGTVLQMLAVEDLFEYNRPEVLDLGQYGRYKEMLSTESYLEGKVFLFRRTGYAHMVRAFHRSCSAATKAVSRVLDRYNMKAALRKKARGWDSSAKSKQSTP